jgi:peptidyl-prolyl cis-trans isomerase A (cyclophilin A)
MRRCSIRRAALGSALLALAGCSRADAPPPAETTATPPSSAPVSTAPVGTAAPPAPGARDGNAPIYHPENATEKAPATFKVSFSTTKGDFVIEVTRAFAPNGADRFYNLVKLGFYDGARFYRAVEGFMVQFGASGDPSVNGAWYRASLPDDPVVKSNTRGFVTFAMAGPNTRSTQVFINYVDKNSRLDAMGFAPFGQVTSGMKVVDALYKGYGELAPKGKGPDGSRVTREGEAYLAKDFPELDRIKTATLL